MDCIVHGVTKSQTQMSNFHFTMEGHHGDFEILAIMNNTAVNMRVQICSEYLWN